MATAPNEPQRTEATSDPWLDRTIGQRYRILRKLGAGGLGSVYAADQIAVRREVAVKLLHADVAFKAEHRDRFEREAQTLALLRHPNIVGILDFGVEDDTNYLVMELAEGQTLAEFIAGPPIPIPLALDLARQLLRALAYAHGQKVVHRDLKPANVVVRRLPDGSHHLLVLDFGIAKFLEEDDRPSLTKQGAILGTPAYMAPEQATGGSTRTTVDVYAAGLVIFELLTGRRPYLDTDRGALLRAHMMSPVPLPSSIRPELGSIPGLDGFVLHALEKKPANRFADALQMLEACEALLADATHRASSSPIAHGATPTAAASPAPVQALTTAASAAGTQGGAAVRLIVETGRRIVTEHPKLVVGAALVVFAGVVAVGFVATRLLDTTAEPASVVPIVAPTVPILPAASSSRIDPFARGVPPELEAMHRSIAAGSNPSRERLQVLYHYNAAHPRDARGQLLLGWTYVNRRWFSDATTAYAEACRREAASANDARLRGDLVRIAATAPFGAAAATTIESCLGPGARAEVEAAAAAADDESTRTRLSALAARLR